MTEINIRPMRAADLSRIMEIERETFRHPWDEGHFRSCLRAKNHHGIVAITENMIVGYCLYSQDKASRTIVSISVAPSHQRRGIGSAFIDGMKTSPKTEITVSESNTTTHHFLKSCGFRAIEVVRGFFDYEDYSEDAYVFRHINGSVAAEADLQCQEKA